MITVSIVSHGHGEMVSHLIKQLEDCPEVTQIILTRNICEPLILKQTDKLEIIENNVPAGFATNHNAAFKRCREPYFCVVNPDIRLSGNIFRKLIRCQKNRNAALVAPMVLSPEGKLEDSVRRFPTFLSLVSKVFGGPDGHYIFTSVDVPFYTECVAGMFMLFETFSYKEINGFDEKYYMYYEDIDICARLWEAGLKIAVCTQVSIIHSARRDSHRKIRFLLWHCASMARYFFKYGFRQYKLAQHILESRYETHP